MMNDHVDMDSIEGILALPQVEGLLENGELAYGAVRGIYYLVGFDRMGRLKSVLEVLKDRGCGGRRDLGGSLETGCAYRPRTIGRPAGCKRYSWRWMRRGC